MPHPRVARAVALATLVTLAAVLAGACGDDGDDGDDAVTTTTTTTTAPAGGSPSSTAAATSTTVAGTLIEVAFAGGQVVGGSRRETVSVGDRVVIRVTSDVADEVHVHTYDVMADVAPGQPVDVVLTASIPGRHEVELEGRGRQLLELEVR